MIRNGKFIASLVAATAILVMQVGAVVAAPGTQEGSISGSVTELQCDTDITTGVTTLLVTVDDGDGNFHTVRIDQLTAEGLGLISVDEDGNPDCSEESLLAVMGTEVDIDSDSVILEEEEPQHPVGSALATFFSDITDYESIMGAHEDGFGFGVIAQALWLTQKLEGDSDIFLSILEAKQSGDYSDFVLEDGTTPENWGQFRNAVLETAKGNPGIVMSDQDNGNGIGNGNGNGNGNGHGNGNNKDKGNKGNGKGKGNR